jgi:hypothetical protein
LIAIEQLPVPGWKKLTTRTFSKIFENFVSENSYIISPSPLAKNARFHGFLHAQRAKSLTLKKAT